MPRHSPKILNELRSLNTHIYFLGTMHIAEESAQKTQEIIESLHPNVVMIELDEMRYQGLVSEIENGETGTEDEDLEEISLDNENPSVSESKSNNSPLPDYFNSTATMPDSFSPFAQRKQSQELKKNPSPSNSEPPDFFSFLADIQQELGKAFQITPGKEMYTAIQTAKSFQIPVLFIDRPILETFARLQAFQSEIEAEQSDLEKTAQEELDSTDDLQKLIAELQNPQAIRDMLKEFQEKYPQIFQIIVQERNEYMCNHIINYQATHPEDTILIIVGAGHVEDLIEMLKPQLSS